MDNNITLDDFTKNLLKASELSQKIATDYLNAPAPANPVQEAVTDPLNVATAFNELVTQMALRPDQIIKAQQNLWQHHFGLWQTFAKRAIGETIPDYIEPAKGDKRFKDKDWQENELFNLIKQSYLVTAQWLQDTVSQVEGLDEDTKKKVEFYTKQITDAFSPTNFLATNPQVLKATLDSKGENLVHGFENFLRDLEHGHGNLFIQQADDTYFEIGKNVATTPGKIVFQNELLQLIQYEPSTKDVYEIPLLIFPAWINKYYILDLRDDNSLIKWCVDQGYTVFVVSWVNPTSELANRTFEDYMNMGILAAIDAVEKATGVREVNTVGYCIGGTLMGSTLAYMAATGDDRVQSGTFFTAQLDFEESGDLKVFTDEAQIKNLEKRMDAAGGVLEAADMAQTFNMLRANDLIWSFVINNYLLGKDPLKFDLLYWNSDSTRMPKALHLYYLRNFYIENKLSSGQMELNGVKLDLGKVKIPVFLQSSRDDHIAPYRSVWRACPLFGGPVQFMIAGSGHIAGVINPPAANKYQYWLNDKDVDSLDEWWDGAKETPGSWWPFWETWLHEKSGPKIPARKPGDGKLDVIEDAPGAYVQVRS